MLVFAYRQDAGATENWRFVEENLACRKELRSCLKFYIMLSKIIARNIMKLAFMRNRLARILSGKGYKEPRS